MPKHVVQPGSIELPLSGVIVSAPDVGGAADLSSLDASNLTSGTVPLARISGLTDAQIAAGAAIAWSKVLKVGSSLADLATRSASDLSSGTVALALLANIADAQIAVAAAIAWSKLSKAGSSLADLATRSAADLSSGTLPLARLAGITNTEIDAAAAIAWSKLSKTGSSLADLATRSAADLSSGLLPDARLPGFVSDGVSRIQQLAFAATQNASADANTLDDYEEGTWTPTLNSMTSSGTITLSGTYTKVGRLVYVRCSVRASTGLVSSNGTSNIGGLPFTAARDATAGAADDSTLAPLATVYASAVISGTVIFTPDFNTTHPVICSGFYEV